MGRHRTHAREGALVIGGDYKSLGVVRSLGRHGIPVWVLTDDHLLAGCSRFCRRAIPWPAGAEADQVAYLLDVARDNALDGWTIFRSYATILDDEGTAIDELRRYRAAGGRSICDPTNVGLGRNPLALRRTQVHAHFWWHHALKHGPRPAFVPILKVLQALLQETQATVWARCGEILKGEDAPSGSVAFCKDVLPTQ